MFEVVVSLVIKTYPVEAADKALLTVMVYSFLTESAETKVSAPVASYITLVTVIGAPQHELQ